MIALPDTSFLTSLYVKQVHSERAAAHFAAMPEPLHVTELTLYEFRLAERLAVYRVEHGAEDVVTREDAVAAFANLEADLRAGSLVETAADWPAHFAEAEKFSSIYTMDSGFRAMDVLHVASAKIFGASEVLTFDAKQRLLAAAVGLRLPL